MAEFAAVTPESHAKKVWKQVTNYTFAASDTVIPLVGSEISKVVPMMPIGFVIYLICRMIALPIAYI